MSPFFIPTPKQKLTLNGKVIFESDKGLYDVFNKLSGAHFGNNLTGYLLYLELMSQTLRVHSWQGQLVLKAQGQQLSHDFTDCIATPPLVA